MSHRVEIGKIFPIAYPQNDLNPFASATPPGVEADPLTTDVFILTSLLTRSTLTSTARGMVVTSTMITKVVNTGFFQNEKRLGCNHFQTTSYSAAATFRFTSRSEMRFHLCLLIRWRVLYHASGSMLIFLAVREDCRLASNGLDGNLWLRTTLRSRFSRPIGRTFIQ